MPDYVDWESVIKGIISFRRFKAPQLPAVKLLEKRGGFFLYQVGERRIYSPSSFDFHGGLEMAYNEIFVDRVYEGGGCLINPGDWVVDAGACEGFFSLYALEKGANVIAFEPIPELAEALRMTLDDYIRRGKAKVFQVGLGERAEEREMFLFKKGVMSSTFSGDKVNHWGEESLGYERVSLKILSLDELFEEGVLPTLSFIKADVEGYERNLLLGARKVIRRFKPKLSICTYHLPDDYMEIPRIVRGFGLNYRIRLKMHFETLGMMYAW